MASASRRILYIAPGHGATAWYRCNVPGRELARRGHTVHLDVAVELNVLYEYDIIVFSNGATEATLAALQYAKSAGKLVIADLDDDPWHMNESNPNLLRWDAQEAALVEGCLSHADRVTTTNPFLAEFLTQFNRSVVVLPNCLPGELWNVEKSAHSKMTIGWVGGHTHYFDLEMVAGPINELLVGRSDLELHLTVFEESPFEPASKVKLLPITFDFAQFPEVFSGIDIGIAPLADNHFNKSKSDLKYLEYAAAGVPCVASDISTYSRIIRHGENGLLAATADDWVACLTELIEDTVVRERIAAEARKTAEGRFIDKNIGLWERAYGLPPSS